MKRSLILLPITAILLAGCATTPPDVAGGGTHAGFRFEPLGGSTWDGFGFASENLLVFSDIPEPTVYAMIGIAGLFCSRSRLCRGTCWLAS